MPTPPQDPTPTTPDFPWWARHTKQPYLTPSQVRLRTPRSILTTLTFTLALTFGMWWVLTATEVDDITHTEFGGIAHKQTNDALIGGCGPMYTFPDPLTTSGTVPAKDTMGISNRQTYRTVVPMFGPFWDKPAPRDQTFWETGEPNIPVAENLLRNMWNGDMVVYYTSQVPDRDVQSLRDVAANNPGILVVPWEEKVRGQLPDFRELAFATWNASQSCHTLSVPAIYDFRDRFPAKAAPGYDGTKPKVISDKPPLNVTSP